ncbi:MAG: dephospho-CoA kinase [Gemmatimonadetes bacterium]|nr:dephospho-CoA kinase [Gemmatimonadota bacterium]
MIRIGLTGTMGAGKSTVGDLFESWGAHRVDADVLARRVVEPGQPGLEAIRETFGAAMIRADGTLDRAALRGVVFEDDQALRRLEAIIHPAVDRMRAALLDQARAEGARVALLEIPLLFEKDMPREFDAVIVVDAPEDVRRQRVCEARGLTAEEFSAMDSAQWPGERKRAAADHVIWNDDDLPSLESEAREVWDAVTGASAAYEQRAEGVVVEWRVDLHTHTSASPDCLSAPADVVRQARKVGLDQIAITDHNQIEGAFEAREIDPDLVIIGEEVRTAEGLDLIGLFLTEHIPRGGTFREVAEEIRRQGGVVYVPHPFDSHRGTSEEFLDGVRDCIDAVEGFNARIHDPRRNQRAQNWALAHGLPLGAGSDAHLLSKIGRARVVMPAFSGPAEFLASLAGGRIEGRASSYLVHLGSTWAKIAGKFGIGE